jgi:transposase
LVKTWCIGLITAAFLSCMENILRLYRLPYDARFPVVSFDERPCFLIGNVIQSLAMKPGQVKKEHYEYEKNGSCALLLGIEPLTGKRIAMVYDQRRKIEYAEFMQHLANQFPNAEKIRLIQDNLNTHNASSFYEHFDAQTAFELSQRFEFHYTPKKASWLNAVEIEFSALSRTAIKGRIPTKEQLQERILDAIKERQDKNITINWAFSITDARRKMNKHYTNVNSENAVYNTDIKDNKI